MPASLIADMAHWHDATGHYARPDLLSLLVNDEEYRVTRSFTSKLNNQLLTTDINKKQGITELSTDIKQLSVNIEHLLGKLPTKDIISTQ